jgi:hypothetical protein
VGLVSGTVLRTGSCHCGGVRFTVELPCELRGARCNCSICSMKGVVMVAAPDYALQITAGEDLLTIYRFNTMAAQHHFCSRCGIHVFHRRRADPGQLGINAACLDGMSPYDFSEIPVMDGANHPLDNGGRLRRAGTLSFEGEVD